MRFFVLPLFILLISACDSPNVPNAAAAPNTTAPPTTPVSTVAPPTSVANPHSLLVWGGQGSNGADLGCLLATLDQQGVNFEVVTESDLSGTTPQVLASHIGLIFPDGTASNVLAQLSSTLQQVLQTSVAQFGLQLIATGGNSSIPATLGLIPTTQTAPIASILQIVEVVLQDISIFIPGAAVISDFLNGLPAIIQMLSGTGTVSLFGPQTTEPSCSTEQSTALSGGTGAVNPLQTLIGLIQNPSLAKVVPVQ